MSKDAYMIDDDTYPIAWRFNAKDCLLSDKDKKRIVFFDEMQSKRLWGLFIPVDNLMRLDGKDFICHEKTTLSFNGSAESADFFEKRLRSVDFIWFFWGACAAAIVPTEVFITAWEDFFYPSDEDSLLLMVNSSRAIHSFEETFFYGDLLSSGDEQAIRL